MSRNSTPQPRVSPLTPSLGRRAVLRSVTTAGLLATVGFSPLVRPAMAAIAGVTVDYKRCHVAFVSNASAVDSLAVYYADRDGTRRAAYGIEPTVTNPREYAPLVVEYDTDEDRTQIQLAEPRGSLVHIVAESASGRTAVTNPTDACVPAGFNSAPAASFTATTDDSSATSNGRLEVDVDETVTYASTATDSDDPERLRYEWDLDGDGVYETTGQTATTSYTEAGDLTVSHRVTDDFDERSVARLTLRVRAPPSREWTVTRELLPTGDNLGIYFGREMAATADTLAVTAEISLSNDLYVYVYDRANLSTPPTRLRVTGARSAPPSIAVAGTSLVVGAPVDTEAGRRAGAVYVYDLTDLDAAPRKLLPDEIVAGDLFGIAVAAAGTTLAVGAAVADTTAGAVYVYDLADLDATPTKLTLDQPERLSGFGRPLAVTAKRLVVGASAEDGVADNTGAVYVYDLADLDAAPTKLVPDGLAANDRFGRTIAAAGDALVVGTYSVASNTGAAWVYDLADLDAGATKVVPDGAESDYLFAFQASTSPTTAVFGSPGDDTRNPFAGAAWVYDLADLDAAPTKVLPDAVRGAVNFGVEVLIQGETLYICARNDSEAGRAAGKVYVLER